MIKCFVFDIQGVIFSTGTQLRSTLAKEGFSLADLERITAHHGDIADKYISGEINWEEYVEEVKKVFPKDYEYILNKYYSTFTPLYLSKSLWDENVTSKYNIPELKVFENNEKVTTIDIIKELSNEYELCAFTGNSKKKIENIDKEYDLFKYFKYKVFSFDVGRDKPSKEMMDALVNTIPYNPSECIYLDDKEENTQLGKQYRFNTVLVK